jgi:hypothetical protein
LVGNCVGGGQGRIGRHGAGPASTWLGENIDCPLILVCNYTSSDCDRLAVAGNRKSASEIGEDRYRRGELRGLRVAVSRVAASRCKYIHCPLVLIGAGSSDGDGVTVAADRNTVAEFGERRVRDSQFSSLGRIGPTGPGFNKNIGRAVDIVERSANGDNPSIAADRDRPSELIVGRPIGCGQLYLRTKRDGNRWVALCQTKRSE